MTDLALVLAGGGIAGIAWETGFLAGVADERPQTARQLLDAGVLVGTSAGATVAAQLGGGLSIAELFERQLAEPVDELTPAVDIDEVMRLFEDVAARAGESPKRDVLRMIGERALTADTVGEEVRRQVIAHRLPSHDWPHRDLRLTAVDAHTGDVVVFTRDSGVGLVDAVAASCAVPAVWPAVTIGDRRYLDGGVASTAHVGVAADCRTAVLLAPTAPPGLSPFGITLADELAAHPSGRAYGIFADEAALAAFGRNPLDPACRAPSAVAGREQGRRQAAAVAEFLGG
ncbi:patatin-like phospholipase family protein [Mycobacterium sp. MYCO198283]|uniref:patatin-like phospholipase family protein n=1 Tax=Mycobacterium sp. MYCO198283 TaxID=2883505 RepID=UPI001E4CA362|nr:patatin-like phospholipase family protein [Mycobacterium sp. MYCO198283]MCG5430893.1 patatin-like phospholipase family protein [Mycobacterium sp. MYCO198283]